MNEKEKDEFRKMALGSKCCIMLIDDGPCYSQAIQGGHSDLALMLAVSIKECPKLVPVIESALEIYKHFEENEFKKTRQW